jgi:transketolase
MFQHIFRSGRQLALSLSRYQRRPGSRSKQEFGEAGMNESRTAALRDMATRLRIHSVAMTSQAGSGHPTSCCSIAEIMAVLFFDTMRYDPQDPTNPNNDRLVLSKGHAAPILYAAWAEAGLFPPDELMKLRRLDSDLEGHPTPRLGFVDVATGSLGQGLSAGCGMAYAGKYLDRGQYRVYVLLGDGEAAEGAVWEAINFAGFYKLDNLVAILDVNRLGQSDPTMFQHDVEIYRRRLEAFGWWTQVVDGHDPAALREAFALAAATTHRPAGVIAKTIKGKDLPGIEDQENWHGKALGDRTDAALSFLRSLLRGSSPPSPPAPVGLLTRPAPSEISIPAPNYRKNDNVATRTAYGTALAKLGSVDTRVVALDGDTKNSTFAEKFNAAHPDRFIEGYIAEQNLVGVAVGLATRGKIPFVSTFACFLTRAFDQLRMAGISRTNVKLVGSHAGVSIGEDGPSQMGLEDLAMFRAIPECVVFYPSDAVATERAVELAANYRGMAFIRTSRPATPIVYEAGESFAIGRAKVVCSDPEDRVTVVAAGVTLFEALAAAEQLAQNGIRVRIVDPFTVKPIDRETLLACARATGGRVVTVEDHYAEGGLGDAVADALSGAHDVIMTKLAVREIPRSGKPTELMHRFGISADRIVAAVEGLISIGRVMPKQAGKNRDRAGDGSKTRRMAARRSRGQGSTRRLVVRRPASAVQSRAGKRAKSRRKARR